MSNILLTIKTKLIVAFILVSIFILTLIYLTFSSLFQEHMLKSEKEKAILIAQTIEPMIGINHYLGLHDDIKQLAKQTTDNENIESLRITIQEKEIFFLPYDKEQRHIHVKYPIKDTTTQLKIGTIDIFYKLENFDKTFNTIQTKIIKYMAFLAITFLLFTLLTRRLLNPLNQIAKKVQNYKLDATLDFSNIRKEVETDAIIEAFKKMVTNIHEHTLLLERYKYAVDESAIVSKSDINGTITYVNDEFCRASGYSRYELLGNTHKIIRHPQTKDEVIKDIWSRLNNKQIWKGTIKNLTKDDQTYHVEITIVPIFDENGNTVEFISMSHDITQIIKQKEQILRQTTNRITNIPNRIKLEEDIKTLQTPKLALVSLDNFYIINDYYGYNTGTYTIKETANIIQKYLKKYNISMYHISAHEFAILADNDIGYTDFNDVYRSILKIIDNYVINSDEHSLNITATAGITYNQHNAIANASMALHHARETGKSSLVYEEASNLVELYNNNIKWTKRIKDALSDDRFVVYVQPIVDAKTLKTDKYECLVRMIDEDENIISPYHFLDISKKSKLYLEITKKVISSAFKVFSQLPDKSFSINISVEDLTNKTNMEFLKQKIKEYDIASRLVLEIVESEGIENFEEIIPLVNELKQLGCEISIDDFGTGYSNFAYLMQLNVDYIKIDGSLIKDIDHNINSQIISKTILDFAVQLELKTVAEFIHNESVMHYTQEMGIDYLQGFHLGEPVPIETLISK